MTNGDKFIVFIIACKKGYFMHQYMLDFAKLNKKTWQDKIDYVGGKILVYVEGNPIVGIIESVLLAKRLEEKLKKEIVVAYDGKCIAKDIKAVYESFNITKFVSINDNSMFSKINIFLNSIFSWLKMNSPMDILSFKYKDIPIGEELYDDIIRTHLGEYTIEKIKKTYIFNIYGFFIRLIGATKVLNSSDLNIDTIVYVDCDYNRSSLIKIGMQNECDIYQSVCGKYYQHKEKLNFKIVKNGQITKDIYDRYKKNVTKHDIELYLKKYFEGSNKECMDQVAFLNKKYYSKEELYELFNIKNQKKNVLVASHAFSDLPHYGKNMIYNDYYQWLIGTLTILSTNKNINVFVKEHPSANFYGEKGSVRDLVRNKKCENVFFLPDDFNTNSAFVIMDYVITCQGTIGLEATIHGIPVITAGQGFYYGFGIDINSDSLSLYEDRLRHIEAISTNVSIEKQECAKLLLYIAGDAYSKNVSSVLPRHRFTDTREHLQDQKYHYEYINNKLKNGASLRDTYYENVLQRIDVYEDV